MLRISIYSLVKIKRGKAFNLSSALTYPYLFKLLFYFCGPAERAVNAQARKIEKIRIKAPLFVVKKCKSKKQNLKNIII